MSTRAQDSHPISIPLSFLGFDPGYGRLGWGVIQNESKRSKFSLVDYGVIETSSEVEMARRIYTIHQESYRLIQRFSPHKLAMERLYFSKNQKTAVGVYQAQGVILSAAAAHAYEVREIDPKVIKRIVTGSGNASKIQVHQILLQILSHTSDIRPDDAADAVAVALAASILSK